MEVIIKGKIAYREKDSCFDRVDEWLFETLAAGTPDIRRVIKSLSALGEYMAKEEDFLVPELMELGYTREESIQIKKDGLPVLEEEALFQKVKRELGGTLVVISSEVRSRVVELIGGLEADESVLIYAILKTELLELTVCASYTGETAHVVGRENKLESSLTSISYLLSVRADLHTLGNGVYACGNKTASAGSFNNTDAACADLVFFFHIAEGRDLYTCCTRSLKNGCALGYAYSNTVNFTIKHFHFCVLLSIIP